MPSRASCHRTRSAVAAVGLGRRLPDESERLPSVRPRTSRPGGLDCARCSHAHSHPAPCRSPRALPWKGRSPSAALPSLVKGWRVTSSYPALLADGDRFRRRPRGVARKMLLTDFCNRPNVTSTHGLSDSWLHPLAEPVSRRVTTRVPARSWAEARARRLGPTARFRNEPPSGASLDGEPPASTSVAWRAGLLGLSPHGPCVRRRAVLAESRSSTPPRAASR
jgi:hypothetical protein